MHLLKLLLMVSLLQFAMGSCNCLGKVSKKETPGRHVEQSHRKACNDALAWLEPLNRWWLLKRRAKTTAALRDAARGSCCFVVGLALEADILTVEPPWDDAKSTRRILEYYRSSCKSKSLVGCAHFAMKTTSFGQSQEWAKLEKYWRANDMERRLRASCRRGDIWSCRALLSFHGLLAEYAGRASHESKEEEMAEKLCRKWDYCQRLAQIHVNKDEIRSSEKIGRFWERMCMREPGQHYDPLDIAEMCGTALMWASDKKAMHLAKRGCELGHSSLCIGGLKRMCAQGQMPEKCLRIYSRASAKCAKNEKRYDKIASIPLEEIRQKR